jgi:hypothetical protein
MLEYRGISCQTIVIQANKDENLVRRFGKSIREIGGEFEENVSESDSRTVTLPASAADMINTVVQNFGQLFEPTSIVLKQIGIPKLDREVRLGQYIYTEIPFKYDPKKTSAPPSVAAETMFKNVVEKLFREGHIDAAWKEHERLVNLRRETTFKDRADAAKDALIAVALNLTDGKAQMEDLQIAVSRYRSLSSGEEPTV